MQFLNTRSLWIMLSLMSVSVSTPVWAEAIVPVGRITAELQDQTQVPILIPNSLPSRDRLYSHIESSYTDGYELSFTYTPDCQGSACTWGYFSAIRGAAPSAETLSDRDTIEAVIFANGIAGWFTNFCGAYCTASAQWVLDDVLYVASIKNGQRNDVIAFANSALSANTSFIAAQPGFLSPGTIGILTSREPDSQINVRDAASTASQAQHYGLVGDQVRILDRTTGSDGQLWYRVEFLGSGATGWVRGDFVRPR